MSPRAGQSWRRTIVLLIILQTLFCTSSSQVSALGIEDFFRSIFGGTTTTTTPSSLDLLSNIQPVSDLERESSTNIEQRAAIRSPAHILRRSFRNGRYTGPGGSPFPVPILERDLFKCVEPTANMYRQFVRQYDRKFADNNEQLERLNLFAVTIRRSIMFNRIIQNEITNGTNYQIKPEIGDYHFIEPVTAGGENVGAIWLVDITDCELGLIKHSLFDVMRLVDNNDFGLALKKAIEFSEHLPILSEEGFEQVANILLLRLYDRFQGDSMMNQLFKWPLYLKKLAAYAYSLRQSMKPYFKEKLSLISFAYPAYFKDIKYNWPAINRTGDNVKTNNEHKRFNSVLNRNFANLRERNKRLVIFRQHWSLINQLNDDPASKFINASIEPEWNRAAETLNSQDNFSGAQSGRLVNSNGFEPASEERFGSAQRNQKFRLTQFSDLTDAEFVAFLTNDYDSLLNNNKESELYLMQNFKVRPLDETLRNEIAQELEFRRTVAINNNNEYQIDQQQQQPGPMQKSLARKVVDELISDVGLPIGPVALEDISEQEYHSTFQRLAQYFKKSYSLAARQNGRFVEPSSAGGSSQLSQADLNDEQLRRYQIFKENYARFKAWHLKEGWQLGEGSQKLLDRMRLADMSWPELKMTLFKVCCLTEENIDILSRNNATIQYLGSNYQLLCQQMHSDSAFAFNPTGSQRLDLQQQQANKRNKQTSDLTALELYYYYSVHFNKHHLNEMEFEKKFVIFKRNIDSIRKHSCKRDLTLFNSLFLRTTDTFNTIDVLDPRRGYTDDLNLDRFEYFNLHKSQILTPVGSDQYDPSSVAATTTSSDFDIEASRAGISYNRGSPRFTALIQRTQLDEFANQPVYSYADKLLDTYENVNDFVLKYKQLTANKVYDFVLARYRYCMKTTKGINLYGANLHQQCQAEGKFQDNAAFNQAGTSLLAPDSESAITSHNARLQQKDHCEVYRRGLEPWAHGLIRQDALSAQLIQTARCHQAAVAAA